MDGFTYSNLFETKGTEYLIIIGFLLLIIPFWIMLNRPVKVSGNLRKNLEILTEGILRIPRGIFFSKNHTWAYLEKNGCVKVGLDDMLLHITGEVDLSTLKHPGMKVSRGDILAELSQNGKSLHVTSPIAGEIISTNRLMVEKPGILNEDPYGQGWVYIIKPTAWKDDIQSFHLADEASEWFSRELNRFRDFLAGAMKKSSPQASVIYLQDGGELTENILHDMPAGVWYDFQEEFLK